MTDVDISEAALRKATGHGREHWHTALDAFGTEISHRERAKALSEAHPEIGGWWVQMLTVDYERAKGLREVGQSHAGDFQVACSATIPIGLDEAWQGVTQASLPGAVWEEGASFDVDGVHIEVRRVDPGKMLRWFWFDGEGKSTVEVDFQDKGDRTVVRFRHHGLPRKESRDAHRTRWKAVLDQLRFA